MNQNSARAMNMKKKKGGKGRKKGGIMTEAQRRRKEKKNARRQVKRGALTTNQPIMSQRQVSQDPRFLSPQGQELTLSNQANQLQIVSSCGSINIIGICIGYLSKALERGFASTTVPQDPYNAYVYLYGVLTQYQQGTVPQLIKLPYWLNALGKALLPKAVPFQNGQAFYTFDGVLPNYIPPTAQKIGFAAFNIFWNVGVPTLTQVNGFPLYDTATPAYDAEEGQAAFARLCSFMSENSGSPELNLLSKMVDLNTKTSLDEDVSAFALVTSSEGLGISGIGGGIANQIQNEVPLFKPILGLLGCGPTTVSARFYNWDTWMSGDQIFLGGALSTLLPERHWGMKRAPRLKPVDFLEFCDVLAKWVSGMITAYAADPINQVGDIDLLPQLQCPLSLQEMTFLFRNTAMAAFKKTQALVQSIYYFQPATSTDTQFTPYVASASTCALSTGGAIWPVAVVENLRAVTGVHVERGQNGGDVQWYIPVLGSRNNLSVNTANYMAFFPPSGTYVNVFATGPTFKKKVKNVKTGIIEYLPVDTTVVSLIDGGSPVGYVGINDPEQLEFLASQWNNWLADSGLLPYSMQCVQFSTEAGISSLRSIQMTRHWLANGEGGLRMARTGTKLKSEQVPEEPELIDIRREKRKRVGLNTLYSNQAAVADSSQSVILSAPYEGVQKIWILPSIQNAYVGSTDQDTLVPRVQAIFGEPYLANLSNSADGINMDDMHQTYASKMLKGKTSPDNEWQKFFDAEAAKGRGGVLSGLLAGIVGSVFPSFGGIASTIADSLPV